MTSTAFLLQQIHHEHSHIQSVHKHAVLRSKVTQILNSNAEDEGKAKSETEIEKYYRRDEKLQQLLDELEAGYIPWGNPLFKMMLRHDGATLLDKVNSLIGTLNLVATLMLGASAGFVEGFYDVKDAVEYSTDWTQKNVHNFFSYFAHDSEYNCFYDFRVFVDVHFS